ncbi:hypothetical protein MML48_7g00004167 [Holotrichia oblita]|uniref:Uncharacterized protein n=2 Tax=Holotrichia oblita TaxID=644536 RepID=A0ACB9SVP9_HOLOL|nr:hypothetical protein MML48_7g00012238 [Holotrichia oblita]KAI4458633.1 hypothetical protein MML48_7g00004167 [Holotrichia oblita]
MEESEPEYIYGWWENLDEEEFQITFRMSKKTCISLQAELDDVEGIDNESSDTFLLCCLWILGNTLPFKDAGPMFDIEDNIEVILAQYLKKISALGETYLAWPTDEEAAEIEEGFLKKYHFPGVVGVIGSLHINVLPDGKQSLYYNTEMDKHTIILQVVCDNHLLLRDVCAGCPGGKDIQTILRSSPLFKKLTDDDSYLIKNNKHLLGGTEHPQMRTLLTPYKGKDLNEKQSKFNVLHNSVMYTVEKTFCYIQSRFPRLTCMDNLHPHLATLLVSAACVLHNFTRVRGESNEFYTDTE